MKCLEMLKLSEKEFAVVIDIIGCFAITKSKKGYKFSITVRSRNKKLIEDLNSIVEGYLYVDDRNKNRNTIYTIEWSSKKQLHAVFNILWKYGMKYKSEELKILERWLKIQGKNPVERQILYQLMKRVDS